MSQETTIKSTKRGVSFENVSASFFTTTTEDTPMSPTLTNTLPLDSGMQTVSSTDSRECKVSMPTASVAKTRKS